MVIDRTYPRRLTTWLLMSSILSSEVKAYNMKPFSGTCQSIQTPTGYNFYDVSTPIVSPDLVSTVDGKCSQDAGGNFLTPQDCSQAMDDAEVQIKKLYQTSDADLAKIVSYLYCTGASGTAVANQLAADSVASVNLNSTIFGNVDARSPGLLRDLISLIDGTKQLSAVATGQYGSIKAASKGQTTAATSVKTSVLQQAQKIQELAVAAMGYLVGNRTLVQNQAFADLDKSVEATTTDLGNQADQIVNDFTEQYNDLYDRYVNWKLLSDDAIKTVSNNATQFKSQIRGLLTQIKSTQTKFQTEQQALAKSQLQQAIASFASSLKDAQSAVSSSLNKVAGSMADTIDQAAQDFYRDQTVDQANIDQAIAALTKSVNADSTVNDNNDALFQQQADSSMSNLAASIQSSILPLVQDVTNALSKANDLQATIDSIRAQVDSDVLSVLTPAQQSAASIGNAVSSNFASAKGNFDIQFGKVKINMDSAISGKVTAANSQLQSIMDSVKSSQSGAAGTQGLQGTAALDGAKASMGAAELTSAKQQLAGDRAQVGLSSMVSVVGAALADSDETNQEIQNKNLNDLQNLNMAIASSQQATADAAYAQLQQSSADAASRTADVRDASFQAQSDAQELESSIELGGQQMSQSVSRAANQANSLLGDISDMLGRVSQNSGSLEQQMAAFEKQAPASFSALMSKIQAYGALMASQGVAGVSNSTTGKDAVATLVNLVNQLQGNVATPGGVSPSLAANEAQTSTDASSLISDIKLLQSRLDQQSKTGAALIQSASQQAYAQSLSQIKSVSSDSTAALSSLLMFNSDLINQKKLEITKSSDSAMDSTMNAAKYLTDAASNFYDRSQMFISDAQGLSMTASRNFSSMISQVNDTLTDVTKQANDLIARLASVGNATSAFQNGVNVRATEIGAEIQAKLKEVSNAILNMTGVSSQSQQQLKQTTQQLSDYVDSLTKSFAQQRSLFNKMAQQYTLRRLAAITGLSDAILSQKANYLSSLAGADLTESQKAAATTDTLQGLLIAVEKAKSQGNGDMTQVTNMINSIGDGVNGLTKTLSSQMNSSLAVMQQQALANGISSGNQLGSTVAGAQANANFLAMQFQQALDSVDDTQANADKAAASTKGDIYAIAGLLKNVGVESRQKMSDLIRQVQSGKITMDEAIAAANEVNVANINSLQDVLNSLGGYIATHAATVSDFESKVNATAAAMNETILQTISDHEQTQAELIGDLATEAQAMSGLAVGFLGQNNSNDGMIGQLENQEMANIESLEDYMNQVLLGNSASTTAQSLLQRSRLRLKRARDAGSPFGQITQTIPDAIASVKQALTNMQGLASNSSASLSSSVDQTLSQGNAAITEILQLTSNALGLTV